MTDTTSIRPVRHGTVQGYRNDGCRDECCRAAKRDHERELQAPKRAARWARIAADHATTGHRPRGCKCDTCSAERTPRKPGHGTVARYDLGCTCPPCVSANDDARTDISDAAARSRARRQQLRLEGTVPVGSWAFIRYAAHQADPNPRSAISPKAVVCCETEALEAEGAGHDWWCPTRIDLDWKAVA